MRTKAATFGRAHGLPKTHNHYADLPTFRPVIDTTTTLQYNVEKFLSSPKSAYFTANQFNLKFDAVSGI